jgi:site-specific DNA recombinase
MPTTNGHGPKRAVLYARVSTDEQARTGYSLAQQIEALRVHAAREGYEVLEEVQDPGESGATLERPGMDRVRDLVAAGGVTVVLAQDRDRFSREPAFLYLLREEFGGHGARIKSLNDRGDESPEGELTDGILDQLAKFERAKTAERSRRGKKQKARLGKIISTRAAYGFDWNAARDGYVINPEQMPVVRLMFYMVGVEARSLCAVQEQLRENGVPSPMGKAQWDLQCIRKMLRRDLYRPHTYEEMREIIGLTCWRAWRPGTSTACTGSASTRTRARGSRRAVRAGGCTGTATHLEFVPWRSASASRFPTPAFRGSGLTPRGPTSRKIAARRTRVGGSGTSRRASYAARSAGG